MLVYAFANYFSAIEYIGLSAHKKALETLYRPLQWSRRLSVPLDGLKGGVSKSIRILVAICQL